MRTLKIFVILFALRFILLPLNIGRGLADSFYHIFMGFFIGMTAVLIDKNFDKIKNFFNKFKRK